VAEQDARVGFGGETAAADANFAACDGGFWRDAIDAWPFVVWHFLT
jgi:hypothetical protein